MVTQRPADHVRTAQQTAAGLPALSGRTGQARLTRRVTHA